MFNIIIFCCLLFPSIVRADIFVPATSDNNALQETLAKDRSGYYYHSPGLDVPQAGKSVSTTVSFPSGTLTRDHDLYDLNASFQKEFDDSFSKEGSFDKYKTAKSSLLLLEYSSPALADVIKHYRVLTEQRLAIEEERLADIERSSQGPLERLRMLSERECLKEKQGEGLVKAMEECKNSSQPFDALPLFNGQASLADGRRNIHVVRDAVALLGLSEKGAPDRIASLSGDVIITDDVYTEVVPKETFESRTDYYRQKFIGKWQDALSPSGSEDIHHSDAVLSGLSLPGVPITEMIFKGLMLLDESSRAGAVAKLSAYLARTSARREYDEALVYFNNMQRLPQLPQEFKLILHGREEYLRSAINRAGDQADAADGYRAMVAGLLIDADTARAGLLAGQQKSSFADMQARSLMISF